MSTQTLQGQRAETLPLWSLDLLYQPDYGEEALARTKLQTESSHLQASQLFGLLANRSLSWSPLFLPSSDRRGRELNTKKHTHTCTYIQTHTYVYIHTCAHTCTYTHKERGGGRERERQRGERDGGAACRMSPRAGSSYCPYLGCLQCARESSQPLLSVCHLSVTATKLVSN